MNEFSYLSVLISIVLGLGIANLLSGMAALISRRANVQLFWPVPIWIVVLFLAHVLTWWAMFGLRNFEQWNFLIFLIVLMQPILLFLMSALIVPDVPASEIANLRATYFRETRPFFAIGVTLLCFSLLRNVMIFGSLPEASNLAVHLLFITLSSIAATTKNEVFHRINAPIALALLVGYIATLFVDLK